MSFAFAKGEEPSVGVRRLAHQGSLMALDLLEGVAPGDPVHETRKILKRTRALARLCRRSIGKKSYRAATDVLGQAADVLAGPRDATIVRRTLEDLTKRRNAPPGGDLILGVLPSHVALTPDAAHDAATLIRTFDARVDEWTFDHRGFRAIEAGLDTAYRDGRRALDCARDTWAPDAVHELRKRAKDLRFDLELVSEAWPEILGPMAHAVDELGDHLGEDHDLAVLADRLHAIGLAPDVTGPWLDAIDHRRHRLRKKVVPLAERIYAERPRAFMRRIEAWFWR